MPSSTSTTFSSDINKKSKIDENKTSLVTTNDSSHIDGNSINRCKEEELCNIMRESISSVDILSNTENCNRTSDTTSTATSNNNIKNFINNIQKSDPININNNNKNNGLGNKKDNYTIKYNENKSNSMPTQCLSSIIPKNRIKQSSSGALTICNKRINNYKSYSNNFKLLHLLNSSKIPDIPELSEIILFSDKRPIRNSDTCCECYLQQISNCDLMNNNNNNKCLCNFNNSCCCCCHCYCCCIYLSSDDNDSSLVTKKSLKNNLPNNNNDNQNNSSIKNTDINLEIPTATTPNKMPNTSGSLDLDFMEELESDTVRNAYFFTLSFPK